MTKLKKKVIVPRYVGTTFDGDAVYRYDKRYFTGSSAYDHEGLDVVRCRWCRWFTHYTATKECSRCHLVVSNLASFIGAGKRAQDYVRKLLSLGVKPRPRQR